MSAATETKMHSHLVLTRPVLPDRGLKTALLKMRRKYGKNTLKLMQQLKILKIKTAFPYIHDFIVNFPFFPIVFPLVEIRANNCCIYSNHTTVSYLPRLAAAEL